MSDWRWTFIVGASPVVLGIFSLLLVPESPRWLALKRRQAEDEKLAPKTSIGEVFRPPILKTTLIGILLGAIPLFGGWGVSNWATAWASEKGDTVKKQASADDAAEKQTAAKSDKPDPILKSMTVVARSLPGSISSLLGGILAFWLGRKKVYVLLCIGALICTQGLFRVENPIDSQVLFTISMFNRELAITSFLAWTFGLGFFSGFFFGWLPLCLPEMFPTRLRATGAGVTFNWGRILTAVGILLSAVALKELFKGRYAEVGKITGFVYAFGLIVIWFAPIKSGKKELDD
ncbi:MAG: MFS transporter [Planctomycetes bacterium]|nr:MFS transporter [Planctomycetota bacterium]